MRLGIVSDTHGHVTLTRPAVRMLESLEVEAVLHCGDIGTREVVEQFAAWPTHFVFGNCDYDRPVLRAAIHEARQTCHEEFGDLEFAAARVALLHSHDRKRFQQAVERDDFDLVCYGHTHVAAVDRHGGTLVVNPGAVYRASPHSVAVVDITPGDPRVIEATIVAL